MERDTVNTAMTENLAGKTEEDPMSAKHSLDITTVVWHSFRSRICAYSWPYYHCLRHYVYLGDCQSYWTSDIHGLVTSGHSTN